MISRREFMQAATAASVIYGGSTPWNRLAAQQKMSQSDLLSFKPYGNVTIAHLTDIHAQIKPIWFREPSINLGVGEAAGKPPHVTGEDFLKLYDLKPGSAEAYALSSEAFVALARQYGRMGGIDRIATVLKHIRDERPGNTLFLDGGDTWQGSYTALQTKGADMVEVMNLLKPDAMTGHWEFTLGADRVKELVDELPFAFLGANIFDNEWEEPAFEPYKMFERGGVKIAVIGQAFPYTPIANPRWMIPNWSFGIREEEIKKQVQIVRDAGYCCRTTVLMWTVKWLLGLKVLMSFCPAIPMMLCPVPCRWARPSSLQPVPAASLSRAWTLMCAMARCRAMPTDLSRYFRMLLRLMRK